MRGIEKENGALRLEMDTLKAKVSQLEGGVKLVESGLEKAKEEVREEVKSELEEKEARSENIVIFGMKESVKDEAKERVKEDETKVKELWKQLEVTMEEGETEVKFRAGKKREDGKPQPLVVKISNMEKKERVLDGARKLKRKDGWQEVFLAPDLTPKQQVEDKKKEEERKAEAEQKTREAVVEGRKGKYIVVGRRGRRRIVWKEEEEAWA